MSTEAAAPTILVVEDDPLTRLLVRDVLRGITDSEVLEAADGFAARVLLEERDVDLVVTDLLMPGLDGLGLMRWAQEHRRGPRWIVLSAVERFDAAVEAHQLGVLDFLTKPVQPESLRVAARNALERIRLERAHERLLVELQDANEQLSHKIGQLERSSEIIRRDLERAEVIQRALLPAEPPLLPGYSVNAVYRPGRHVGGDLYNVMKIGERHVALWVADATGHGVASAMLSVLFSRRLALTGEDGLPLPPARALEAVNNALTRDHVGPGLFLTAALGLLDLESHELRIAGAGHPPVVIRRGAGGMERVLRTGPALGLVAGASYAEVSLTLDAGDRALFFTDGLHGATDGDTLKRVELAFRASPTDGHALLMDLLTRTFAEDPGAEDRDDITLILLDARSGPSRFDNGDSRSPRAAGMARKGASTTNGLWYGELEKQCWLAVRGRGTWTECDTFHETITSLLGDGVPVVLDLSSCDYLDSTFLGTIHELVSYAQQHDGARFVLHGVREPVRNAFGELSMERVLAAAGEVDGTAPAMQPLASQALDAGRSRERLRHAHEALSSLSPGNRERFGNVTEALRSDSGG